jgi:hypothetical protein
MRVKIIAQMSVLALVLLGCSTTKYHWGSYENSLYRYYKNPADVEELGEALAEVIEEGEAKGRVPPGIYAEYGYVLLNIGRAPEAIIYFEKEKNAWPESSILMNNMIDFAKCSVEKESKQETNWSP